MGILMKMPRSSRSCEIFGSRPAVLNKSVLVIRTPGDCE